VESGEGEAKPRGWVSLHLPPAWQKAVA
jgi:hypothetical protein